ncbi:hypothetical protein D3880_18140 [Pseudomonas cavernae]|uniref:Uncharacterized protein n=1 Tax=Pseudomonas cavernae TaxID=2320867 RepID=A0A385Z846_9PSED|nr:hypothetical protein [Pseudomonas cavernae]AYC34163.1 hypothetical protein D3880_18140 [Pseudomonas cavernae]
MKLEIARGLFLIGALGVASLAAAAWHEPGPQVLGTPAAQDHCPLPVQHQGLKSARPDGDLLLLMFGLSQGLRSQG